MMKRRAVLLRVWWTSLVMGSSFVAQRYVQTWLIPRVLELTNFLVTNSFSSGAGWRMGKLTYGTCLFACLAAFGICSDGAGDGMLVIVHG